VFTTFGTGFATSAGFSSSEVAQAVASAPTAKKAAVTMAVGFRGESMIFIARLLLRELQLPCSALDNHGRASG
jgi:hypothetical protein